MTVDDDETKQTTQRASSKNQNSKEKQSKRKTGPARSPLPPALVVPQIALRARRLVDVLRVVALHVEI
jgi:hypothetical protein